MVTVAGAAVTAAPITGYLTLVLSDVTDSTFVMDTIPGNAVRGPTQHCRSVGYLLVCSPCAQLWLVALTAPFTSPPYPAAWWARQPHSQVVHFSACLRHIFPVQH